jgi:hypothetical protein
MYVLLLHSKMKALVVIYFLRERWLVAFSQIHPRPVVSQPDFSFLKVRHHFVHFIPECG